MKTAFIGLGNMGAPMAHNLFKAGHVLSVLDLNTQAVGTLAEAGTATAASPKDAVMGAETVITTLSVAVHVCHVLMAEDDVLVGIAEGMPIIDSSTIDPVSAKASGVMVAEHDNPFVDASVPGGTGGVATGTLIFMVGGSAAAFEQVRPVLSAMGEDLAYCDDAGAGQGVKICNNLMLGIMMTGAAEAMSLGEALSTDPKALSGTINTSTGRCRSLDTYNPLPGVIGTASSSRGYMGGSGTDLMLKDLGLVGDTAELVRQPAYLDTLVQQLYQTASSKGDGKLDFSAVIKPYRKNGMA